MLSYARDMTVVQDPGIVITPAEVEPVLSADPQVHVRDMIKPEHYAEPLVLRHLTFSAGRSGPRSDQAHDEMLYVLSGSGTVAIHQGGAHSSHEIGSGSAIQILAGCEWFMTASEQIELLSFLVPAPVTPFAAAIEKPAAPVIDVAELGQQNSETATCDRQFEVLFDASRGSRGATMFVGFIPTSGAPEHYHLYDEICVIVSGSGVLHALGREQALTAGSAFHVAPRLLHALENPHDEDLWVLGVFRPEGSAAAAFYPDGRPAPNNQD
jgi:quercetin dioxygenase-like cupin family protein